MISVDAPWVLGAAVAGALITCVLHLLSVRRPPTLLLPTMRFLPDRPVRAVSRTARPSDLWLLLLRVAALLLAGVGLAGVSWKNARGDMGRVIVVDRSAHSSDATALRAQVTRLLGTNLPVKSGNALTTPANLSEVSNVVATRVVVMDSVAHLLSASELRAFKPDTLTTTVRGVSMTAAVLAAIRSAATMTHDERNVDSVELDIVSEFHESADDAALRTVRASWPGRINLVDVVNAAHVDSAAQNVRVHIVGAALAPVVASALRISELKAPKRVASAATAAATSANDVGIEWPANGVPTGWSRAPGDTVGAIVAEGRAIVWPFVRAAQLPDSLLPHWRAIAWWSDGRVAAAEQTHAAGCTRQVGVIVPSDGDALSGESARRFLATLVSACGDARETETLNATARQLLTGKDGTAPADAFRSRSSRTTPFGAVMLLLALLLLALEWWVRDREPSTAAVIGERAASMRKVA